MHDESVNIRKTDFCGFSNINKWFLGFIIVNYQSLRHPGQADYFCEVVGYLVQNLLQPHDFDWLIDQFYFDHSSLRLS